MKNIVKVLLCMLLFLGAFSKAEAQEKYEYAVITYQIDASKIVISINGNELKTIGASKTSKEYFDANPALKEVSKMNEEGWEVFSTGVLWEYKTLFFYLRKKK